MRRFIIIICALILGLNTAHARIKVIDGDSIFINQREIRLSGIDAPEYDQSCFDAEDKPYACGAEAHKALQKMVDNTLKCRKVATDRYHREVSVCYAGGQNLNRQMVLQGWAVAYNRYTHDYDRAEAEAQRLKRGIWQGRFMQPEFYRILKRQKKLSSAATKLKK